MERRLFVRVKHFCCVYSIASKREGALCKNANILVHRALLLLDVHRARDKLDNLVALARRRPKGEKDDAEQDGPEADISGELAGAYHTIPA